MTNSSRTMSGFGCGVALVLLVALSAPAPAATVFSAGFETTDTPSYPNGAQIHTAGGQPYRWNWSGNDIGRVTNDPVAVSSGSQGLSALRSTTPGSQYWWTRGTNAFAPLTNGVVQISFAVKATNWTSSASSLLECWVLTEPLDASDNAFNKAARSAYITLLGNSRLQAYTNNSIAFNLRTNVAVDAWNQIRLEITLATRSYNVFLNGNQVATNFTFYGTNAVSAVHSIQFKEYNSGLTTGGVYLDDVVVSHVVDEVTVAIATFSPTGPVSSIQLNGTSPDRVYSVQGLVNLLEQPQVWVDMGVSGLGNGGSLLLTVTNDAESRIYRAASSALPP